MLIHIERSAASDAASRSATAERSRACIENLLLAHFQGDHVISLLPDDAAVLRAISPPWSDRARRALDHIEESYAQIAGLRDEISWSLELGIGAGFEGDGGAVMDGMKIIRASLHRFEKIHTAACAALLGENMTDAEFFRQLGLMMRALRRWGGVDMVHEPRGTGGSTFALEFAQVASRGRIALAIADSDRRHPGCGFGDTYKQLQAVASALPGYQRAEPLPTRTAEGLVPLSVYRDAFVSPHDRGDERLGVVTRLDQLCRSAPSDVVLYAHFKDGITLYEIECPKTKAEGDYWRVIAKKTGRDACKRSSEQCAKRDECQCYVVDRLGGKALADVVTWMKTRKLKKDLASRFDLSGRPSLSALADEVLAWGLALRPLMT